MTFLKTSISLLFVLAMSCNTSKTITSNNENEMSTEDTNTEQKMIEAGFKKGTIIYSEEEGDCPYTIQIEENGNFFDPINLEESYKTGGLNVWVKYNGLRMMNRCIKANPVSIAEIQKRAE